MFTNLGERGDADFQNVEFAINRRFSGKWMLLTSFGMTWSTMAHTQTANGNLGRYGNTTFPYRPADRLMGELKQATAEATAAREATARLEGELAVLPHEIDTQHLHGAGFGVHLRRLVDQEPHARVLERTRHGLGRFVVVIAAAGENAPR